MVRGCGGSALVLAAVVVEVVTMLVAFVEWVEVG